MLGSFIKLVIMVSIASIAAIGLTHAFDVWYNDCEARRRAKWERRKNEGRYE